MIPSSNLGVASTKKLNAEVAELADAQDLKSCGTYLSYRFDSGLRHHINIAGWSSWQLVGLITRRSQVRVLPPQPNKYGPLVKRSRHRPFTAVTGVRFPYGSPISRDYSSAGRAPALQAGGHRFEPCWSHLCRRGGTGRRTGLKILRA